MSRIIDHCILVMMLFLGSNGAPPQAPVSQEAFLGSISSYGASSHRRSPKTSASMCRLPNLHNMDVSPHLAMAQTWSVSSLLQPQISNLETAARAFRGCLHFGLRVWDDFSWNFKVCNIMNLLCAVCFQTFAFSTQALSSFLGLTRGPQTDMVQDEWHMLAPQHCSISKLHSISHWQITSTTIHDARLHLPFPSLFSCIVDVSLWVLQEGVHICMPALVCTVFNQFHLSCLRIFTVLIRFVIHLSSFGGPLSAFFFPWQESRNPCFPDWTWTAPWVTCPIIHFPVEMQKALAMKHGLCRPEDGLLGSAHKFRQRWVQPHEAWASAAMITLLLQTSWWLAQAGSCPSHPHLLCFCPSILLSSMVTMATTRSSSCHASRQHTTIMVFSCCQIWTLWKSRHHLLLPPSSSRTHQAVLGRENRCKAI